MELVSGKAHRCLIFNFPKILHHFSKLLYISNRFGPRFPPMSDAYDKELRKLALAVGQELGFAEKMKEGVYCCLGGPNFETIAECRMLNSVGVDAVGMY